MPIYGNKRRRNEWSRELDVMNNKVCEQSYTDGMTSKKAPNVPKSKMEKRSTFRSRPTLPPYFFLVARQHFRLVMLLRLRHASFHPQHLLPQHVHLVPQCRLSLLPFLPSFKVRCHRTRRCVRVRLRFQRAHSQFCSRLHSGSLTSDRTCTRVSETRVLRPTPFRYGRVHFLVVIMIGGVMVLPVHPVGELAAGPWRRTGPAHSVRRDDMSVSCGDAAGEIGYRRVELRRGPAR